jgi:hypothetical protein
MYSSRSLEYKLTISIFSINVNNAKYNSGFSSKARKGSEDGALSASSVRQGWGQSSCSRGTGAPQDGGVRGGRARLSGLLQD